MVEPKLKPPITPSFNLNSAKSGSSNSSKYEIKGLYHNRKKYDSLIKEYDFIMGHRDSSRSLNKLNELRKKGDSLVPFNIDLRRINGESIKSIEGFKDVNRRNKKIVEDIIK